MMIGALVGNWRKRHKPSTAYNYRAKLKALLSAMAPFGLQPMRVPKVPLPNQRATIATGDELYRLLKQPPAFLRLFILLYLQCGLRRAEALAVTPRTWDREHHTVTIRVKGGRIRTAQITDDVEALLVSAGDPDPDTSYISALRGKNLTGRVILMAWQTHRKKCGINPEVTAHDLRRTAATILYHATKDLRVPQQLLGHKNLASTLSYLAPMAPDEARKYQELLRFEHFKSEVKQ
ncbi:MAG: site-specific integrase [Candidatus Acidiferrum sp.]